MLMSLITLCLLAVHFSPSQSFSLPLQCVGVSCRDDSICVVNDQLEGICKPISTKRGSCPESVRNPECLLLRGAPLCLLDEECPGETKCCRGCCEEAAALNPERPTSDEKTGVCPPTIQYNAVYWWTDLFCPDRGFIDDCQDDTQCPGTDKCCPGLCGKECTEPDGNSSPQSETKTTTTTTVATTTTASTTPGEAVVETTETTTPVSEGGNTTAAAEGAGSAAGENEKQAGNVTRLVIEPPLGNEGDGGNFTRLQIEPPLVNEGDVENVTRLMIEPPLLGEDGPRNVTRLAIQPPLVNVSKDNNITRLAIQPPLVNENEDNNITRLAIQPPLVNENEDNNITRLAIQPPLVNEENNFSRLAIQPPLFGENEFKNYTVEPVVFGNPSRNASSSAAVNSTSEADNNA